MSFLDNIQGEQQTNPMDVLMELLNDNNIELKTDLNISQISVLFQQYFYTEILKECNKDKDPFEIWEKCLVYFMKLMTSLERKREKAIIDGIKDMKDKFLELPLVQGLRK